MGYKQYQQLVNITINKPTTNKKITKIRQPTKKTRSKSGCLTCRKRKKKCDEDVVNGKCQGCTRNFLSCEWSHSITASSSNTMMTPDSCPVLPKITKVDIKSLCNEDVIVPKQDAAPTVINPYPSPLPSPRIETKVMTNEVKPLILEKKVDKMDNTFIITSVDNNKRLVNI